MKTLNSYEVEEVENGWIVTKGRSITDPGETYVFQTSEDMTEFFSENVGG